MKALKFFNLVDKGRWVRGPWSNEPDLIVYQMRRGKTIYACVIKRDRGSGALTAFLLPPDGDPTSIQSRHGMRARVSMDDGIDLGMQYCLRLENQPRSASPNSYDPAYTYYTVDRLMEILSEKATLVEADAERIRTSQAPNGDTGEDLFEPDAHDEEDGEEEEDEDIDEEDEDTEDEDPEEEDIVAVPSLTINTQTFLSTDEIFTPSRRPNT